MIEQIIIDYLAAHGFDAYAEEPAEPQAPPYFVIQKTGGRGSSKLRRATVAVQSYGATMQGAAASNNVVIGLLLGMTALDEIAAVSLNSDYNYTDTATKRYRYQAVFDITYYETEANA